MDSENFSGQFVDAGIGGELTLTKSSIHALTLSGASTYSGGTFVNAGTLRANNSTGSATGSGGVTIGNGATFGGDGAIAGPVTVLAGGTLAPGNSPGQLDTGSVSFNLNSDLTIELGGLTSDLTYDFLNVTGSATLAGNLTVTYFNGFTASEGDTFTFLSTTGGITGNFANFNLPALGPGLNWTTTNDGFNYRLTAVPEPTTVGLFISAGLFAVGALHRRRKLP